MKLTARTGALRALKRIRMDGAWPDAAVREVIRFIPAQDIALCTRLVYTAAQNYALCDAYIAKHCTVKPNKLQPPVLDALRLGVCQLKLMDAIPERAAIFETVEIVKYAQGGKAAGLCNAVLRAVARDSGDIAAETGGTAGLALRHSHPEWLVERLSARYGMNKTEKLLKLNNTPPPLTIHVNPLKTTADKLIKDFEKIGAEASIFDGITDCITVSYKGDITRTDMWEKGLFIIADPAARLIAEAVTPKSGELICDCCAAPGGKTFLMAFIAKNECVINAMDIHEHKVNNLKQNISRLGLDSRVSVVTGDARSWTASQGYNAVLVDAPCSGMGVIRKRPDIRYKSPADLAELPELQLQILQNAGNNVLPGGRLIYSTCTLLPEENEMLIARFLEKHPEFTLKTERTLWPPDTGTDGFYFAVMKRMQ